jgi:uncharacterized protein DUF4193
LRPQRSLGSFHFPPRTPTPYLLEQMTGATGYPVSAGGMVRPAPERTIPVAPNGGEGRRDPHVRLREVEEEEEDLRDNEDDDEAEDTHVQAEAEDDSGDASLDEILTKKPEERPAPEEEEEEESVLSLGREDRIETLSVKVEPKKDTEFVCQKCHLVKPIRSQLADKKRMYCRDCA